MKICSKCKSEKDLKEFNKNQDYCRECQKEYKRKWKEKNGEINKIREAEKRKEQRKDPAFREKENKRRRTPEYRQRNNDLWKQRYYGERHEAIKRQHLINAHIRRARKLQAEDTLTPEEWLEILQLFRFCCAYCGSSKDIQMDHIKPIIKGGGTTKENVLPACKSCNCSKQDKNLLHWLSS